MSVAIATASAGSVKGNGVARGQSRRPTVRRPVWKLRLSDRGAAVVDGASGDLLGHLAVCEAAGNTFAWVAPVRVTFAALET